MYVADSLNRYLISYTGETTCLSAFLCTCMHLQWALAWCRRTPKEQTLYRWRSCHSAWIMSLWHDNTSWKRKWSMRMCALVHRDLWHSGKQWCPLRPVYNCQLALGRLPAPTRHKKVWRRPENIRFRTSTRTTLIEQHCPSTSTAPTRTMRHYSRHYCPILQHFYNRMVQRCWLYPYAEPRADVVCRFAQYSPTITTLTCTDCERRTRTS
jgi:hypothetical protein